MSNASVPVTIFNASQMAVQVSVNGGGQFTISGTGPGQNWQPQQPNPNPLSFSNGYPAPNTFGSMGANQVMIFIGGTPASLNIGIPGGVPINSLQFYFFSSYSGVSWFMLNNGQVISSGSSSPYSSSEMTNEEESADRSESLETE